MNNVWINPVYDRRYSDIQKALGNPEMENAKGCFNYTDLNRIENNTAYVLEYMLEHKIIRTAPVLRIKTNWNSTEIVIASEIKRIIGNISLLCSLSNPAIQEDLPHLYLATQINYTLANNMEKALDVMHTQPELPINYFYLTLHDGIITTIERLDGTIETINNTTALIAEDEIAHITGVAPSPDAQYKVFTNWSGNADDLQYIGNVTDMTTTYTGQYHNVEFTANFKTVYPRTLTLSNAYISINGDDTAETGPSSGIYTAGDDVMIIANRAPSGKVFYCWEGTQAALDAISVSENDPSTIWLAMPDTNVTLQPRYINAGQHYVSVHNGYGSGWYDYNETVSISPNIPSHYGFDNWSGDTNYLDDIYSYSQSFKMPDIGVDITAQYSYRYSYNNVQVINGKIVVNGENVSQAESLRQNTTYTLVPEPTYPNYGIYQWQIEGYGHVSGNTFTVGDGNAIITGIYRPIRTLTLENVNNGGGTNTYSIVEGRQMTISTNRMVGDYKFTGWYENGTLLSSNYEYTVTMGASDRTIEARYEYVPSYTVTLINRNNSGQTITYTVKRGNYWEASTTEDVGDYLLSRWLRDGTEVTTSTSYNFNVYTDTTIEIEYRPKETYYLTVNNGSGSGYYKERESVTITADEGNFSSWTTSNIYSIANNKSRTTTVKLGRHDGTVTANFNMRTITVITNSGTNTYSVRQGSSIDIYSGTAPNDYEFDKWIIDSGDASISNIYSSSTTLTAYTENSTVRATYKAIPYFNVSVTNGYVKINNQWVTSGTVIRGSSPEITMKPASEGYRFLQWEVLVGENNDVYQPLAETTRLRNVTHNISIIATYYIPDPEVTYTLTITQKDGTIQTYNNPVGTQQNISAQSPDTGYRFYRWNGDYQYLTRGRYEADNVVNTPAQNISLQATYVMEGYITKYHLYMYGGECLISRTTDSQTNETTETWATDGEFEEGSVVEIRTTTIPFGWRFNGWQGATNAQTALINNINIQNTTIRISDFDCHITGTVIEEAKYTMKINNGGTSGQYYADARVDVYFNKVNTNDENYIFNRWTGDVSYLNLYSGGVFDVTNPGTVNNPQYVKMPARNIEITASYTVQYKLKIYNGTFLQNGQWITEGFVNQGDTVQIKADTIQGKEFFMWEGGDNDIGNVYDPTTTITIGTSAKTLTAKYSTVANRNNIGYGLISFVNDDIIDISDITIIHGTVDTGFIITDSKGHIYVVTNVNNNDVTITRMTKISKGGNVYE